MSVNENALAQASAALAQNDATGLKEAINQLQPPFTKDLHQALGRLGKQIFDRDVPLAMQVYTLLADENDDFAQLLVATAFMQGDGLPQNRARALHYYHLAAAAGNQDANYALGQLAATGDPQDFEAARRYFQAAGNHPDALNMLGNFAFEGVGQPEDREQAQAYFLGAAKANNPQAMVSLALLALSEMDGNMPAAMNWLRKAAALHEPRAYLALGNVYEDGIGTAVDLDAATFWYQKLPDGDLRAEALARVEALRH